jgi:predicted DNA-binding transcriptional regulator YafY
VNALPPTTTEARPPREEGFSKDADKQIRRLSLVAFLLARPGRPASAGEIRRRVEGYSLMTDDAFKRRFYEDRAELAELGIEIAHESAAEADAELYTLPAAAYYLPAIAFEPDELSALATCLFVLGDLFAYSEPLRLALLSLSDMRPMLPADDLAAPVSVLPESEARRVATALPKVQQAVAARKTIAFTYYSIGRDEELPREVDPYLLLVVGDEWYLIGLCHLRGAIRTFRLSRITSKVSFATRAPHDFAPPERFDLAAYVNRPPWQLGEVTAEASIRVSAAMAWWVEAHYAHCGTTTPAAGDSGDIVYSTGYHASLPLVAWALRLGEAAEIVAPAALRDEATDLLRRLAERLAHPPGVPDGLLHADGFEKAVTGGSAGGSLKKGEHRDWEIEVDHFTRLTALTTYLYTACRDAGGDDETPLSVDAICAALDISRDELRADVRLLNLVNFGGEGTLLWAEFKGDRLLVTCDLAAPAFARPPRLSPLQADTLLLAVELLGGQLPTEHGAALSSAAQKLRRARSAAPPALAAADPLPPGEEVLEAVNTAVRDRRVLEIEYWSAGTGKSSTRAVEPMLLLRSHAEWYYVAWCRSSQAVRTFRVATTKAATATDERFKPRDEVELDLYRREGVLASTDYAADCATLWHSPSVARWAAERGPVVELADGACLSRQPYIDTRWLVHEVLHHAGEALPLAPEAAVAATLEAVDLLVARYS